MLDKQDLFAFDINSLFSQYSDDETNYLKMCAKFSPYISVGYPQMLMDQQAKSVDLDISQSEAFLLLQPAQDTHRFRKRIHFLEYIDPPQERIINKGHTGCSCGKTKCLKLYCICLQKGNYCDLNCKCIGCKNDLFNEKERLSILSGKKFQSLFSSCKCKKTKCLLQYCECHMNGRKCSSSCKCKTCKNK